MWLPLLRSKLGENYQKTSAAFIWATIARLYAARRTGLKKELFGYLPGGYGRMLKSFHERLEQRGVQVRLHAQVKTVDRDPATGTPSAVVVDTATGPQEFDRVILTVPSSLVSRLCPNLSETGKQSHEQIEYQGIVCGSLLLKRPLANYYVTNITDGHVPFTGVIEMTALVDPKEFGGQTLVYLPRYLPADDPAYELSDEETKEQFLVGLESMYPNFDREDVLAFRISRVRSVMALSTLGYSTKLPSQTTSIHGVDIVNSAQIVNCTLNVNETVRLAEEAASRLIQSMACPIPTGSNDNDQALRERIARS
jgi:protoporphyrinogen oxidase